MSTASPASRLLARALEPGPGAPEDAVGAQILDAALWLAAAGGMRNLTMDGVAARARVGRMTVYRRFGTRQALLDALALREARRCLAEIASSFNPRDRLDRRAADLFVATLRVIREHPLLARLVRVEPEAFLHELGREDSEIFALVRTFLIAQIGAARAAGELSVEDPQALVELIIRLAASFVLIPGGVLAGDDERARAAIGGLLSRLATGGEPQPL
jgi:AcrR family transcriptional regulator